MCRVRAGKTRCGRWGKSDRGFGWKTTFAHRAHIFRDRDRFVLAFGWRRQRRCRTRIHRFEHTAKILLSSYYYILFEPIEWWIRKWFGYNLVHLQWHAWMNGRKIKCASIQSATNPHIKWNTIDWIALYAQSTTAFALLPQWRLLLLHV